MGVIPEGNRIMKLKTLSEASELLRTPVATLRYWRHIGYGPTSFKIGRNVVYDAADLEAWIQAQKNSGGPEAA